MDKKISADLDEKSLKILQWMKKQYGRSYGETIRLLLRIFANPSADTQKRLLELLTAELERIDKARQNVLGEVEKSSLDRQYNEIMEIARYYNGGHHISVGNEDLSRMQRVEIKGGYVLCPKDWKILNAEESEDCDRARIIEVHDESNTHFVMLCTKKPVDSKEILKMQELCKAIRPEANRFSVNEMYIDGDPAYEEGYKPPYGAKIVLE